MKNPTETVRRKLVFPNSIRKIIRETKRKEKKNETKLKAQQKEKIKSHAGQIKDQTKNTASLTY